MPISTDQAALLQQLRDQGYVVLLVEPSEKGWRAVCGPMQRITLRICCPLRQSEFVELTRSK